MLESAVEFIVRHGNQNDIASAAFWYAHADQIPEEIVIQEINKILSRIVRDNAVELGFNDIPYLEEK